jgi:DNA polymerase (family 10)
MGNEDIVRVLERTADFLELEGMESFRIRPWLNAASMVRRSEYDIAGLVERDGLEGVHALGIGYEVAGAICDYVRSGVMPILRKLENRHRPEMQLACLPGIGPKLAQEVHDVLGVETLDDLEKAVQDGRLADVCGFGPRRVELVNEVLASMRRRGRFARRGGEPKQLLLEM